MQGLKPRPGERGQQEVVQEEGGADAQPAGRVLHQPAVQQEEQVEEEERHAELDQDLSRDVPQKFPGQEPSVRLLLSLDGRSCSCNFSLTRIKDTTATWQPGTQPRFRSRCR